VHAVRPRGERTVEPIVDEHSRPRSGDRADAPRQDAGHGGPFEVALAHLDEIDAGARRQHDAANERILEVFVVRRAAGGLMKCAAPIGDHAQHRTHGYSLRGWNEVPSEVGGVRDVIEATSSANPR
jgi:hypothetical protein